MSRRHSPAVYRRRRIVVFGGLLLVLAGIGLGVWLLIAQPWAADAAGVGPGTGTPAAPISSEEPAADPDEADAGAETDTQTDATASDDEPVTEPDTEVSEGEPEEAVAEVAPCEARNIRVEAVTDATTYRADALPKLSVRLTNNGASDCVMNVGSATQVFTITSGDDVWWRSTDCQTEPSDMLVTLTAGATVTTQEPLVWDRTRSSVSNCDQENRPRARAGGASYHLSVEIGGVRSMSTQQIFLN